MEARDQIARRRGLLAMWAVMLLAFAGRLAAGAVGLYRSLPSELSPVEDRGIVIET